MHTSLRSASILYKGSAPNISLRVDVIKINKLAGRKEARAEVSNCALHPASFISFGDQYGTWFVSIVSSELESCGFLLSFRSFDHTGEASYNAHHYLIRDARRGFRDASPVRQLVDVGRQAFPHLRHGEHADGIQVAALGLIGST
jgi:hypothetical protein